MNYRQLGNTGIQVSEIGMGCWGIGSDAYGDSNDKQSIATIHEALYQGITFFDTADIYGNGHSEELLGEAIGPYRNRVIIATKVGSLPHTGREMPVALDPMHITLSCNESLKRLKTDYIDLYQLHSPPIDLMDRAIETLHMLKLDGKIRAVGVSAKSPWDAIEAVANPLVDVVQVNFNMIDQRARECGLLEICEENEVGVIARTPLAFGFLTGKYQKGDKFTAPDHRANWSQEQIDVWAEAPRLFNNIQMEGGLFLNELALGYCLSHPVVSTVIPGMMTPKEVVDNTRRFVVSDVEIEAIQNIYNSNNFFIGD